MSFMLSVTINSYAVTVNFIMLSDTINSIMQSVVMLNIIMLNVVVPCKYPE
jgi:hypothetical protein